MNELKSNKTRSSKYETQELTTPKIEKKKIKKDDIEDEDIESPHHLLKKIIFFSILIIVLFGVYITTIETHLFKVNEYKVESPNIPDSFHGFKIVQISDIHYGTTTNKKQLDKIVKKVNYLKPDIIVFTGDLIDNSISINDTIKKEVIDSFKNMEVSLYKYAIKGDNDIDNKQFDEIMNSSNFKILNNESTLLYFESNKPILLTGFNTVKTNPDYSIINKDINDIKTSDLYNIVITHDSNSIDDIISEKPDIIISGGTLGGLIKLPYLKPLFLPENNKKYYEQQFNIDNTEIFISNGIGTSKINARFNNIPSISLFRLYKTSD